VQVAPSGSRETVSSSEGALLGSEHSQAVDLMAQTHVLGSRKVSVLKAAEELAASAEALRGRLRDLVGRLGQEGRDGVSDVSGRAAIAGL
jgi:predicted alpha/beta-hydrolase family hydrolase